MTVFLVNYIYYVGHKVPVIPQQITNSHSCHYLFMALIRRTIFSFRTLVWTWTSAGGHRGGHSCKTKHVRKKYPHWAI